MKKLLLFAAIVIIAGYSTKVMGQVGTVTTTAASTASATILEGMTLTKGATELNFGSMTVPTAATTVTMSAAGVLSGGTGIILLTQAPIASVAAFVVAGTKGSGYSINLPTADVDLASGANHMQVNTFTSNKASNKSTIDGGTGFDNFTVGAVLNLDNGQPAGSYTGTYNVTVNYN